MIETGRVRRAVVYTLRDLVGGLLLGLAAGAAVERLLAGISLAAARVAAGLIALAILGAAARWWGRDLARVTGDDPQRTGRMSAIFFGVPVILAGAILAVIEPMAVQRGARMGLSIHAVYTVLFVVSTLVVTALGSFGLGFGMRNRGFGTRLAVTAGPAGAIAFLVVALFMYAIGWRVGAPRAAERATMVVVTLLGLGAAAIAAGAMIGRVAGAEMHRAGARLAALGCPS